MEKKYHLASKRPQKTMCFPLFDFQTCLRNFDKLLAQARVYIRKAQMPCICHQIVHPCVKHRPYVSLISAYSSTDPVVR